MNQVTRPIREIEMQKLNDAQLRAWVRSGEPITGVSDGGGLTFTLSKAGTASWILRYRIAGKAKELTLGRYPDLGLADARKLASAKRVQVQQVVDVAAEKQKLKAETKGRGTLLELAELWLNHAIRGRHKHPQVTERVVQSDILASIGRRDPRDLSKGDITRLLAKINASGRPTIANDALRYIKAILAYGEALGMVDRNVAEGLRIDHAGGKEKARDRSLSQTELTLLFQAIRSAEISFGRDNELAVNLLLSLGCRKMELFAAKWSEVDLIEARWRIPSSRTKTGQTRELHLSAPVLRWLEELRIRGCSSEYVFPARRASKRFGHVSPDTTWRALKDLKHGLEPFSVHDLRRTSRSLMSELGVPFDVAEKILGHKLPGSAAIYDRGNSDSEQRKALEKLSQRVHRLSLPKPTNDNVVDIKGVRHA